MWKMHFGATPAPRPPWVLWAGACGSKLLCFVPSLPRSSSCRGEVFRVKVAPRRWKIRKGNDGFRWTGEGFAFVFTRAENTPKISSNPIIMDVPYVLIPSGFSLDLVFSSVSVVIYIVMYFSQTCIACVKSMFVVVRFVWSKIENVLGNPFFIPAHGYCST